MIHYTNLRFAEESDLKALSEIYTKAFPESVTFYYGKGSEKRVAKLMTPSWQVLLDAGAKIIVVGEPVIGYCCYNTQDHLYGKKTISFLCNSFKNYWYSFKKGELRLRITEIYRLIKSQYLMKKHYKVTLPIPRGRIMSIAILPNSQSKGTGKLLLDSALSDIGNQHVVLEVRPQNKKAVGLYSSAGFSVIGKTRDLLGDWLIMVKKPIRGKNENEN